MIRGKKKRRGPITNGAGHLNNENSAPFELTDPLAGEAAQSDTIPVPAMEGPVELSKRDRRRAKEARKQAEEVAQKVAWKEAKAADRKARPRGDTAAEQNAKLRKDDGFVMPKGKGKTKWRQPESSPFTDERVTKAVEMVGQYREKMLDKWGDAWSSESQAEQGGCRSEEC